MQNQPPILNIKMVPAGVELVLAALNKLPRETSDPLFQEIAGQYGYQMQELQQAAQAAQAAQATQPQAEAAQAPAGAADAAVGGTD
jgi:hypothetical protein